MSELKATPGPWMVLASVRQSQFCVLTEGGIREDICRTYGFPPSNEANAHLIASAPDLYAALAEVRYAAARQLAGWGKGIEPSERLQEAFDAADRALSKARGQS